MKTPSVKLRSNYSVSLIMVRYIVNLCPHASDEADLLRKKAFDSVGSRFITVNEY
jgi:hypothetical protein